MADSLAGVVLAAGAGTRLAPLTLLRPKALCPVGDRPLVDHAIEAVAQVVDDVAVNVHHHPEMMQAHLEDLSGRRGVALHISLEGTGSFESTGPLGTAGAVAKLGPWLDGRAALVSNADTWHRAALSVLLQGWNHRNVRVLTTTPGAFGARSTVVASLLPPAAVAMLVERLTCGAGPGVGRCVRPAGLWEVCWRKESTEGRLQTVHTDATLIDCGDPAGYLGANLEWARLNGDSRLVVGSSVVGEGATVHGSLTRCVIWPNSVVQTGESLRDAIRAEDLTVLVR